MGTLGFTAFISTRGDVMTGTANVKVLFIAGFGPIVRDREESRKLYRDRLGIPFQRPDQKLTAPTRPSIFRGKWRVT
jgi:hypothetical protein